MKLKDFIAEFMQNNEVVLENKDNYEMHYKYLPEENENIVLMDWECKYTNVSDCEIISVKNVIRKYVGQHVTLKIDTDLKDFIFEKDKVNLTNSPLWLYNKMHEATIIPCGDACSGD